MKRILFLVWLFAIAAIAAQLEVGPGQTYTTISAALTAANPNDVINIHEGNYTETCAIVDAGLTLQSNASDTVTIYGRITASGRSNLVINGLNLVGSANTWTATLHGIDLQNSVNMSIFNCEIDGGSNLTGSASAIYVRNSSEVYIGTNFIHGAEKGINLSSGFSTDDTFENGVHVRYNTITDCLHDGIDILGEYFTINNNLIYNNMDTNWSAFHPDGIQFIRSDVDGYSNVRFARLYNNIIYNHTQNIYLEGWGTNDPVSNVQIWNNVLFNQNTGIVNGVDMSAVDNLHNIQIRGGQDIWIYNNTFGPDSGSGIRIFNDVNTNVPGSGIQKPNSIFIKNNIFYEDDASENSYEITWDTDATNAFAANAVDYNLYYLPHNKAVSWYGTNYTSMAAFAAAHPQEANGQQGDPVMGALPTPSLTSSSPAKDAGVALGSPYDTDILGFSRPSGAAWDMGAYEFDQGKWSPTWVPSVSGLRLEAD